MNQRPQKFIEPVVTVTPRYFHTRVRRANSCKCLELKNRRNYNETVHRRPELERIVYSYDKFLLFTMALASNPASAQEIYVNLYTNKCMRLVFERDKSLPFCWASIQKLLPLPVSFAATTNIIIPFPAVVS